MITLDCSDVQRSLFLQQKDIAGVSQMVAQCFYSDKSQFVVVDNYTLSPRDLRSSKSQIISYVAHWQTAAYKEGKFNHISGPTSWTPNNCSKSILCKSTLIQSTPTPIHWFSCYPLIYLFYFFSDVHKHKPLPVLPHALYCYSTKHKLIFQLNLKIVWEAFSS